MPKIKKGLWIERKSFDNLDGRLRMVKAFKEVKTELEVALGGDLSPQEEHLIDRAIFLLYRIKTFESMLLEGKTPSNEQEAFYNSWTSRLQSILLAVGLKRVPKPAIDLTEALAQIEKEDHVGRS